MNTSDDARQAAGNTVTRGGGRSRSIAMIVIFDVAGPLAAYSVLRSAGLTAVTALLASAVFPALGVTIGASRARHPAPVPARRPPHPASERRHEPQRPVRHGGDGIAFLDVLAAHMHARGWSAYITIPAGRVTSLFVQDPHDHPKCGDIIAALDAATGHWWYWFSWAERIAPAHAPAAAADAIIRALQRPADEPELLGAPPAASRAQHQDRLPYGALMFSLPSCESSGAAPKIRQR